MKTILWSSLARLEHSIPILCRSLFRTAEPGLHLMRKDIGYIRESPTKLSSRLPAHVTLVELWSVMITVPVFASEMLTLSYGPFFSDTGTSLTSIIVPFCFTTEGVASI